jgi:hypothetical protein
MWSQIGEIGVERERKTEGLDTRTGGLSTKTGRRLPPPQAGVPSNFSLAMVRSNNRYSRCYGGYSNDGYVVCRD